MTETIRELGERLVKQGKLKQDDLDKYVEQPEPEETPAPTPLLPPPETREQIRARQMKSTAAWEARDWCRKFYPWRCLS